MGGEQVKRAGGSGIGAESQGAAQGAQVRPARYVHGQEGERPGFQIDLQARQRLDPSLVAGGDEFDHPG